MPTTLNYQNRRPDYVSGFLEHRGLGSSKFPVFLRPKLTKSFFMKHYCQFTRTLISVIFALVFCGIPLHTSGQANENVKPGAIILLSTKGLVQAIDPVGNVVAGILKPGAVLAEGYSLKTGFGGEGCFVIL